jgi:hypothetical protein
VICAARADVVDGPWVTIAALNESLKISIVQPIKLTLPTAGRMYR